MLSVLCASDSGVPTTPWRPSRFTPQERSLALADASGRAYSFVGSMIKQPSSVFNDRDELESLRDKLSLIDEELYNSIFFIEILSRMLDKAQLNRSRCSYARRNYYDQCQVLAEKRAKSRIIQLPFEIVSQICTLAIRPWISHREVQRYSTAWGTLLSHSICIATDDMELLTVLKSRPLSKFRKVLEISEKVREKPLKLIKDAHHRREIKSLHLFSISSSNQDSSALPRIQKDLLRICDALTIPRFDGDPDILLDSSHVWSDDAAPNLRTIRCPLHYLPALGALLQKVTTLEVQLPMGYLYTSMLEQRVGGLVAPCLQTLVIVGRLVSDAFDDEDQAVLQFPSVLSLSIKSMTAADTLLILKSLKCDSLLSLELLIKKPDFLSSVPQLLEYVCTNVGTLTWLKFDFAFPSGQIDAVVHFIRVLVPTEEGDVPLPGLTRLEIPFMDSILNPLIDMLSSRAMRCKPIRKLVLSTRSQSDSIDSQVDRIGLYVVDVILECGEE